MNVEATVGWGQWGDATYLNIRRLAAADPFSADACDGACARARLTPAALHASLSADSVLNLAVESPRFPCAQPPTVAA